jgi:hypothetical protein
LVHFFRFGYHVPGKIWQPWFQQIIVTHMLNILHLRVNASVTVKIKNKT